MSRSPGRRRVTSRKTAVDSGTALLWCTEGGSPIRILLFFLALLVVFNWWMERPSTSYETPSLFVTKSNAAAAAATSASPNQRLGSSASTTTMKERDGLQQQRESSAAKNRNNFDDDARHSREGDADKVGEHDNNDGYDDTNHDGDDPEAAGGHDDGEETPPGFERRSPKEYLPEGDGDDSEGEEDPEDAADDRGDKDIDTPQYGDDPNPEAMVQGA